MVSNEEKLLKIMEVNQRLNKTKKSKELEKNRLNTSITWTGGNVLCGVAVFFAPGINDQWFIFSLFFLGAILGIPFIFWVSSNLKKVNQKIEQLEKELTLLKKGLKVS